MSDIKKYIFVLFLSVSGVALMSAQTPVETVISHYEDVKGARNFIATGGKMTIARSLLRKTEVAPIASEVEKLAVLKMQNATPSVRGEFVDELDAALKKYEYYGHQATKNGEVDIYVLLSGSETVSELVIYNPVIYSLNSLYGNFSVQTLLKLDSRNNP